MTRQWTPPPPQSEPATERIPVQRGHEMHPPSPVGTQTRRRGKWMVIGIALLVLTGGVSTAAVMSSQRSTAAKQSAVASTDSCRGSGCTLTYSTPATTDAPVVPASAQVGQVVTNGGITLMVKKAGPDDSILMNETGYRPGSGYERYTKTLPQAGGRFVEVTTHVVNNSKVSLDLTCSLPINTKLIDAQQRNFDAIDDLYKIKGNPECNKQLQPGFEADMTWVYLVPTSASVIGWGFQDTTDLSSVSDFATVRFDA